MSKSWPSKNQWRQLFKVLNRREKATFSLLLVLFFSSFTFLSADFYLEKTKVVPAAGGTYAEGLIGFPRFINPIYAANSDVDRDLTELIFSGLLKYNSEGNLRPDLAKSYRILEDGEVYEFQLKEDILWHDGQPLTAEDIVFTIETIQNAEVKSPLRGSWLGVEVKEISDLKVRLRLTNKSSIFLENCTLKIIPKHIWENTPPENFPLSPLNLNPVGSGPYQLEDFSQDKEGIISSLILTKNQHYFQDSPYLSKISFRFFDTEEELLASYEKGEVDGFPLDSIEEPPQCSLTDEEDPKECQEGNLYSFSLPRYFAVFFNLKDSPIFEERKVRLALNYGTNKEELINSFFAKGEARIVSSPLLSEIYGLEDPNNIYLYNPQKAEMLLEEVGFQINKEGLREKIIEKEPAFAFQSDLSVGSQGDEVTQLQKCLAEPPAGGPDIYPQAQITGYFGSQTKAAVIRFQEKYRKDVLDPFGIANGTGEVRSKTREKLNEICFGELEERIPLEFSLITVNQPILIQVANNIESQWKKLGADINIQVLDINTIKREILRKRDFEALLFGEALGMIPDPFPFWHSSQIGELGLNLANYTNEDCDRLLEDNRECFSEEERKEILEEFQRVLINDCPVVFLYSPEYRYFVSKKIKGINVDLVADPSKRFTEIEKWYVNTKRTFR